MDQPLGLGVYTHVRVIMGIVLGLSMARLLTGLARFVQHPERHRIFLPHLGWAFALLLTVVHFWWWEFRLSGITRWTFELYLFVIFYAILLFLLCTLLFPDRIDEYEGYEDYFLSRRKWFFGLLALTMVVDLFDTWVKGPDRMAALGLEYQIKSAVTFVLCLIGMATANMRFHAAFVSVYLVYYASWVLRAFDLLD